VASDGSNAFVAGHTYSTVAWVFGTTSIVSASSTYADVFVAKLDSTGSVTWVNKYTGGNNGNVSDQSD
jgi:FlaG/FlaF family flagellin (archaellin)